MRHKASSRTQVPWAGRGGARRKSHVRNFTGFLASGACFLLASNLVLPCCCSSLDLTPVVLPRWGDRKENHTTPLLSVLFEEELLTVVRLAELQVLTNKVMLVKRSMFLVQNVPLTHIFNLWSMIKTDLVLWWHLFFPRKDESRILSCHTYAVPKFVWLKHKSPSLHCLV